MKALSIRQPWAWLIVNGYKPIENRDWDTNFRGPLLIHAGKAMCNIMTFEDIVKYYDVPEVDPSSVELECGGIVGQVTLYATVSRSKSRWFHGDYGFCLKDAKPLPFYPCRGYLGFFDLDYK